MCMCVNTGKPPNKSTEGAQLIFMSLMRGQSPPDRGSFTLYIQYVIGGNLLVHCKEGNYSV